MVLLVDGVPNVVDTTFEQEFKLQPEQLEKAITSKTRLLIINSPSNPTGKTYTKEELRALGEVLLKYPRVMVVSDDIYEHNLWNHTPFVNIVNACPELKERCIVVNGVSKSYAMTGWRIGYAAGPAKVIAAMKKAQSQSTSNPCSIAQYAAKEALEGSQACIKEMTQAYKERHDFLVGELQTIPGFSCRPSDGTFYTFPSVHELIGAKTGLKDDIALAEFLLNEADLALVPGSAFGAPGHIRFCYTVSMEQLKTAVERLRKAIAKLTMS